jgi:hypothetical protein
LNGAVSWRSKRENMKTRYMKSFDAGLVADLPGPHPGPQPPGPQPPPQNPVPQPPSQPNRPHPPPQPNRAQSTDPQPKTHGGTMGGTGIGGAITTGMMGVVSQVGMTVLLDPRATPVRAD